MPNYNYVAWFRDRSIEPDDQDYEWPACIIIRAPSEQAAMVWGDRLAINYSRRSERYQFLRSYLNEDVWTPSSVPHVNYGEDGSDAHIGW